MKGKFLLLGSNLGDKQNNINAALKMVSIHIGELILMSSLYRTSAWGMEKQADFINLVIKVQTGLSPAELLLQIHQVEQGLGRIRRERWENRIIDIDILYYENLIINEADLVVPHPGIPLRNFTLVPLSEVAPDEVHPVLKLSNAELLIRSKDKGIVEKIEKENINIPDFASLLPG